MDLVPLALIALLIQKIIERLRESLPEVPWLSGWRVNLLATVMGIGFAFACRVQAFEAIATGFTMPWWLDQLLTGFGLAAGAGWFSDLAGRSGPRSVR